jgi:hypothetical protein
MVRATSLVFVISAMEDDWPIKLSMAAEGTFSAVDPSGSERIARK